MKKILLLPLCLIFSLPLSAETITVNNVTELDAANKKAQPGDVVILKNGIWMNVEITLTCTGSKAQPVTFKAETAGKVIISGKSSLKFSGSYIIVDGLFFTNGYSGKDPVINFRSGKNDVANNCRVTNTAIDDFNNPKRMDENYWVSFSGKNNRVDHCSFVNKKNMGVLMAVVLDDDRSRENFHSIDHNYFGQRLPLASNSGEIIRVGVSQHALFNSNTQITDNHFQNCDGETEIVSIKSSANVVRNNYFEKCQGGVVLRHGNYNTVERNFFSGDGKPGTGGVRVINKGQWVVNNFFLGCRGTGFRSPLSLMNGVPNSPPIRYVEVSEAVISNNVFAACAPISLCEGSDSERSVVPHHVVFQNNVFDVEKDTIVYNAYDDISKITFVNNIVNNSVNQQLTNGFIKMSDSTVLPNMQSLSDKGWSDSLLSIAKTRSVSSMINPTDTFRQIVVNAMSSTGAPWFVVAEQKNTKLKRVKCRTVAEVVSQLAKTYDGSLQIELTGKEYIFDIPLQIGSDIAITSSNKNVRIGCKDQLAAMIELKGNGTLKLEHLNADLGAMRAITFLTSDLTGSSNHSNFSVSNSSFSNANGTFFTAAKSTVLDSLIVSNTTFKNMNGTLFNFNNETDKKGYYNVEKISFINNDFINNKGQLLGLVRSGSDESTMGPLLTFTGNKVTDNSNEQPLIKLNGVQVSFINNNDFSKSSKDAVLIEYEDIVRAAHVLDNNKIIASGKVIPDKFVTQKNNTITP